MEVVKKIVSVYSEILHNKKKKRIVQMFFCLIVGTAGVCFALDSIFTERGIELFTFENFKNGIEVLRKMMS